nr:stabilizer of axonemal microtubules 1 isoform X2 [Pogona vitticeps]
MASPVTPHLSQTSEKCICEICNCGRHRCPHLLTRPFAMNEKPCLLSEYTDKYPIYTNVKPRDSCKPKIDYKKQPVPMEGISTTRRDYIPHEVSPNKQRPPEKYVKKDENMDLLSTYKQDYNPHPITRVLPCLPQERHISSDKMTTKPTYKSDYVEWNQPKRHMIKPDNAYHPSDQKFDHRTTNQDNYLYMGPVITKSYKPFQAPQIPNIPLEGMTNYKQNYVAYPMPKRYIHEREPFKPNDVPFEGLTTHSLSYKGLAGEPAKSMKPSFIRPNVDKFVGSTEFQEKYLAWPTPTTVVRKCEVYKPPKEKMDLKTVAQLHYVDPHGRPAISCKPLSHVPQSTEPFNSHSTMKEDYKPWQCARPKAIIPHPEIRLPAEPMDTLTTFQAHYVPPPLSFTKIFRPQNPPSRPHVPFNGETTYGKSYTLKDFCICPASYKEPPGYIFEKVDENGHRQFRPATVAQLQRTSSSKISSRRGQPFY